MKKQIIPGLVLSLLWLLIAFFLILVPINLHSIGFWLTMILALFLYLVGAVLGGMVFTKSAPDQKPGKAVMIPSYLLFVLFLVFVLMNLVGSRIFHAGGYASILQVSNSEFTDDLPEVAGTDSIALMDTSSAKKLGDREIGSLSNVVSQFNVAYEYTQIDYNGKPKKVAELEYAGFFKWMNNKKEGVPGYVTVDPVTMSADYKALTENMTYVPSAYWGQDAARHIFLNYPTVMFGNLHFEIDEEGIPYYVASIYEKSISLFGGERITGCLIMNPVTGEISRYALGEVPQWVDVVVDGNTICQQYNWYGKLSNGFWNSMIGKKGCKQVTEYREQEDEEDEDVPVSDYGYVAKDGDIWIYTGVTSVNSDSSNIGFLMANERTGEARFYSVSGADENSAMAAAEGEVQEKGYQASFPSLINVDGCPTYIMVLKDSSGLVKLYAAVNVEQYNLVTTASTQKECISRYKAKMGMEDPEQDDKPIPEEELTAEGEITITIKEIRDIVNDGNTYLYLIGTEGELYKAKAGTHEDMLLLEQGQKVKLSYAGNVIISCEAVEE